MSGVVVVVVVVVCTFLQKNKTILCKTVRLVELILEREMGAVVPINAISKCF